MLSTNAYYYGPCVKFVDTDNEKADINITRLFLFDETDGYVVMMLLSNPRGVSLVLNLIKDDPQCRVDLLRNKHPNLSATPSPDAVTFLRNNLAAIDWGMLSRNTCPAFPKTPGRFLEVLPKVNREKLEMQMEKPQNWRICDPASSGTSGPASVRQTFPGSKPEVNWK